jgi:hypothetical protein
VTFIAPRSTSVLNAMTDLLDPMPRGLAEG